MSYAEQVRGELTRIRPGSHCCRRAELAAVVETSGVSSDDGLALYVDTASLARRLYSSFKEELGLRPLVERMPRRRWGKSYRLRVPGYDGDTDANYRALVRHRLRDRRCCRQAYLRGFFLGRGSVNDPGKEHHLELTTHDDRTAALLLGLMKEFGLWARVGRRKKDTSVVYLKDAESIVTFLNLIGAHHSLMQFENVRVYKDLKGRVNRLVNMETANVGRMVQASVQQLEAIEVIDERMGLHRLPPSLAAVARARLRHSDLSLEELGQSMSPPLSKSAINHRLRRLVAMARRLEKPSHREKA